MKNPDNLNKDAIIIDNTKPSDAKSAFSMTPEEHKNIGSTPIKKITGEENIVNYLKGGLTALLEMHKILIDPNTDTHLKTRYQKIFNTSTDSFDKDVKYFAKKEKTTPEKLLQKINSLD